MKNINDKSNIKKQKQKQKKREKTSLTTFDLSSLLKKNTQTLKSVNLRYISFNFFQFQPSVRIFR
jgi:hypothetical protein